MRGNVLSHKILKYRVMTAVWLWPNFGRNFWSLLFPQKNSFHLNQVRKIAFFRYGSIGDVLMTTPTVRAVRQQFTEAHISYYVGSWSREAIEGNPNVDEIAELVPINIRKFSWRKQRDYIKQLSAKEYDLAFFLEGGGPYAHIAAYLAGIPIRVGWTEPQRNFLLTHKVPRSWNDSGHMVDWYLDLPRFLGIHEAGKQMEIQITQRDRNFIDCFLHKASLDPCDLLVGIFPGGGMNPGTILYAKRWLKERYAQLGDWLTEQYGAKIVIVGGSEDVSISQEVAALMKKPAVIASGETSLKQTAALLERCSLYIGNDSAPMHLAAAVGTPTVSIFGPTNSTRLAPMGDKHRVVKSDIDCSPCYQEILGFFPRCKSVECMKSITVEKVFEAVRTQITK